MKVKTSTRCKPTSLLVFGMPNSAINFLRGVPGAKSERSFLSGCSMAIVTAHPDTAAAARTADTASKQAAAIRVMHAGNGVGGAVFGMVL
jgi:hypothetical protein